MYLIVKIHWFLYIVGISLVINFVLNYVEGDVSGNVNRKGNNNVYYTDTNQMNNCENNEDCIKEIQSVSCKISSEQSVADAHATVTITRNLAGGCNARNMESRFQQLENKMIRQLEELKRLILQNSPTRDEITDSQDRDTNFLIPTPRQAEIDQFNNTVYKLSNLDLRGEVDKEISVILKEYEFGNEDEIYVYNYYWKIEDIENKLKYWERGRFERSPNICVMGQQGYEMYLKLTPKYFPDGTTFISAGVTQGPFDDILEWPFTFKLRIQLLDVSNIPKSKTPEDRSSRIWNPSTVCSERFWSRPLKIPGIRFNDNPECVGLSVPRLFFFTESSSNILSRYIFRDSVLIKLTAYTRKKKKNYV